MIVNEDEVLHFNNTQKNHKDSQKFKQNTNNLLRNDSSEPEFDTNALKAQRGTIYKRQIEIRY